MGSKSAPAPTSTTTVSKAEPPAYLQPFLTEIAQQASNIYHGPAPTFFPGSTIAPLSGQTQQALNLTEQRALAGSPLLRNAQGQIGATSGGAFLPFQLQGAAARQLTDTASGAFNNPYLNSAIQAQINPFVEQFTQSTLPGARSAFIAAGRGGSEAEADTVGRLIGQGQRQVADIAGGLSAQAYEAERQRQLAAAGGGLQAFQAERDNQLRAGLLAPQLAQADYGDIGQLANVGAARDALAQQQLQEQIARHDFAQNQPLASLGQYAALVGSGNVGGTTTTIGPGQAQAQGNPFLTGAGLGLSTLSTLGGLGVGMPYAAPLALGAGLLGAFF